MSGRGFNTFHGFDHGPPPPAFGPQQLASHPGFLMPSPAFGFSARQQPTFSAAIVAPYPGMAGPPPYPSAGVFGAQHANWEPGIGYGIPNISFRNPSGGVGMPPGYNYLFPTEHTTIHAFTTGATAPWQMVVMPHDTSKHIKVFVPTNTTVGELISGLGAKNENKKKNVVHEVVEKGNGQWAKGISINADEKDKFKKTVAEYGWDKTRTGFPGQRPVVWLYITKD